MRDELVPEFKMLDVDEPSPLERARVIPDQRMVTIGTDV